MVVVDRRSKQLEQHYPLRRQRQMCIRDRQKGQKKKSTLDLFMEIFDSLIQFQEKLNKMLGKFTKEVDDSDISKFIYQSLTIGDIANEVCLNIIELIKSFKIYDEQQRNSLNFDRTLGQAQNIQNIYQICNYKNQMDQMFQQLSNLIDEEFGNDE
eukprot:TRINITY_DN48883_c0_g1_i1.p2 TRINITY_DN48883_c0_g1~~TRINITY_DN48883_c0_g1_i1.p2  ORF type:complete len:155 (+),score=35.24 TRINITY_DN48883_c0_g1_i1:36-500(+)